ncbi:MAG: DUF2953 domain-containing protein [Ruminococcus sp.]|nr:DUF2953 domain-containing protein [Ruminococcus sp.]
MLWLYILLGILLGILLILLIPIRIRLKYQKEFELLLYIGFVKLRLIPAKPKKPKKEKSKGKSKEKTEEKPKEAEKNKNIIQEKGISWLVNLIKKVSELACGVLKDFFKHIIIKRMMLSIVIAEDDAAKTAINYGYYCSAVYPAVGIIVRSAKCKKYGIDIKPNFDENAKSSYYFDLDVKILVIWILAVIFGHGKEIIDVIKEFR